MPAHKVKKAEKKSEILTFAATPAQRKLIDAGARGQDMNRSAFLLWLVRQNADAALRRKKLNEAALEVEAKYDAGEPITLEEFEVLKQNTALLKEENEKSEEKNRLLEEALLYLKVIDRVADQLHAQQEQIASLTLTAGWATNALNVMSDAFEEAAPDAFAAVLKRHAEALSPAAYRAARKAESK